MSKKKRTGKKQEAEQEVSLKEYLDARTELEKTREQYQAQPEEKGLSKAITKFFDAREAREKVLVSRKKYLWIMILLGWCGGHRFMAKRWGLGIFYLLLCWTGFPVAMTLIDLLQTIPIPPDENGNILV